MFKRFMVMLLFSLAASIFVIPTRAAGSAWTAWLYEDQLGRMTEVDSGGNILKQFQLPADSAGTYSQHVAVSQDGGLVAYDVTNATSNTVYVYNLLTNSNVFAFNAPQTAHTSFEFSGGPLSYSENNDTFAFSYGGVGIFWTLVVVDLRAFKASSLKQGDLKDPALADISITYLPVINANRSKQISFFLIPYGTDGSPTYQAYTWDQTNNTVAPSNAYISLDTTTFIPTHEVLSAVSDDRFPNSRMPDTGFPINNTLQIFDPGINQRYVVTSLPNIFNPQFIQAGERVAVSHFDVQADGSQTQSLQVLERSGALSGVVADAPSTGINTVLGTQDGFIFSYSSGGDPKASGTDLYYVETRQANGAYNAVAVWSSALGANGRLVWVTDMTPVSTTPFTAWGRVEAPTVTPTPVVGDGSGTSNGVPVGDSAYAVGVTALVQTTNNDVLNLRSGPGVNFQRLGTIANGTLVTLIEGPTNADGFIWWRVRLPTGSEGWVVAQADGINTLIPH